MHTTMAELSAEAALPQPLESLIAAQRPGWTLERVFYTHPAIFQLDLERVFFRHWLFVGVLGSIPRPGDYFLYAIGAESIVVMRGDGGSVHAFYNVCRHRGSRVLLEPCGHAERIVCPYHQWVYGRDGQLEKARLMPADFDRAAHGLRPVHARVVAGMVFLCLAESPPDFDVVAADFEPYFVPYQFERCRIVHVERHTVRANWKLIAENFRECYHCDATHPEYCRTVADARIAANPRRGQVDPDQMAQWRALGLATHEVRFGADRQHHISRYPLMPGFESWTLNGKSAAPLMGAQGGRHGSLVGAVLYPNFWSESGCEYATTTRVTPMGPTTSEVEVTWYADASAVPGENCDLERLVQVWRATSQQDLTLCENNQAGVNSRTFEAGPYSPWEREGRCDHVVKWYLTEVARA